MFEFQSWLSPVLLLLSSAFPISGLYQFTEDNVNNQHHTDKEFVCKGINIPVNLNVSNCITNVISKLQWFVNGSVIAQYTYKQNNMFPLRIATNFSNHFNIIVNSTTIMDNVQNITSLWLVNTTDMQGAVLQCGSDLSRSNNFIIRNNNDSIQPNNSVEFLYCYARCYSSSSGTCNIQYIQNSSALINGSLNGTVNSDDIGTPEELQSGIIYYIAIFNVNGNKYMIQNSTNIQYNKWSGEVLALTIIGVLLIIVNFIIIIGIAIGLYKTFKEKKLLKVIIISVLLVYCVTISFSCWIAGVVEVGKSDRCSNLNQPLGILIAATVISGVCIILEIAAVGLVHAVNARIKPKQAKRISAVEDWQNKEKVPNFRFDELGMVLNEHGNKVVEDNLHVSGHKRVGESTQTARCRVAEEHTLEAKKLKSQVENGDDGLNKAEVNNNGEVSKNDGEVSKTGGDVPKSSHDVPKKSGDIPKKSGDVPKKETPLNIYSTTEHVGPKNNQKMKPQQISNYSRMGSKPESPGELHYSPLLHNSAGPSGASSAAASSIATTTVDANMSHSNPAGYGQLGSQHGSSSLWPRFGKATSKEGGTAAEYGKLEEQEGTESVEKGKSRGKNNEERKKGNKPNSSKET